MWRAGNITITEMIGELGMHSQWKEDTYHMGLKFLQERGFAKILGGLYSPTGNPVAACIHADWGWYSRHSYGWESEEVRQKQSKIIQ